MTTIILQEYHTGGHKARPPDGDDGDWDADGLHPLELGQYPLLRSVILDCRLTVDKDNFPIETWMNRVDTYN